MNAADYVNRLIGRPWSRRFHCWTLVRLVQRDLFRRAAPLSPLGARPGSHAERLALFDPALYPDWRRAPAPVHGAVALMSSGMMPNSHAGVFLALDGGGVLHVDDPHGCVFDGPLELTLRGWSAAYFIPAAPEP